MQDDEDAKSQHDAADQTAPGQRGDQQPAHGALVFLDEEAQPDRPGQEESGHDREAGDHEREEINHRLLGGRFGAARLDCDQRIDHKPLQLGHDGAQALHLEAGSLFGSEILDGFRLAGEGLDPVADVPFDACRNGGIIHQSQHNLAKLLLGRIYDHLDFCLIVSIDLLAEIGRDEDQGGFLAIGYGLVGLLPAGIALQLVDDQGVNFIHRLGNFTPIRPFIQVDQVDLDFNPRHPDLFCTSRCTSG